MEHDTATLRLHLPPTGEERADLGAHSFKLIPHVVDWSSFPELVPSILSTTPSEH